MRTSISRRPSCDDLRALPRSLARSSRRDSSARRDNSARRDSFRGGFTLVEVLTATALTLILMSLLAGVFAHVTDSVNNSRATIELNAQLTGVAYRLQKDLEGYTVRMDPLRDDTSDGYFEVMEGRLGTPGSTATGPFWPPRKGSSGRPYESAMLNQAVAANFNDNPAAGGYAPDTTLADRDDVLMFTTRSRHEPFSGRFGDGSFTSEVAEVAWFVRGTTLYRRVLLVGAPTVPVGGGTVAPVAWWEGVQRYVRMGTGMNAGQVVVDSTGLNPWNPAQGFYGHIDLSFRTEGSQVDLDAATQTTGTSIVRRVPNTLSDLAQRENRYAHRTTGSYPHDARFWNLAIGMTWTPYATPTGLGLPVLAECTHQDFPIPANSANAIAAPTSMPTAAQGLFDQLTVLGRHPMDAVIANPTDPGRPEDVAAGRLRNYGMQGVPDPNNLRRVNEDVIMTNVIGFDIKVWDPGAPVFVKAGGVTVLPGDMQYPVLGNYAGQTSFPASMNPWVDPSTTAAYQLAGFGAYVNLGYAPDYIAPDTVAGVAPPIPNFNGLGNPRSRLNATNNAPIAVYDTWTNAYEADGFDQDGVGGADQGTNGVDDIIAPATAATGGVDDENEREAPPPYPFQLRGVQITLRVIEPGTQQIREVTVTQDFILE